MRAGRALAHLPHHAMRAPHNRFVKMLATVLAVVHLMPARCSVRSQLVDQLGINESRCKTCLISWCFPCGSNTQMTQTLLDRNVPAYVFMDDDSDGRNPLLDADEQ